MTVDVLQVTVEVLQVIVEVLQVTVEVLEVTVDVVQVFHEAQLLRTMSVEAGGLAIAALGNHARISFSGCKSVTTTAVTVSCRKQEIFFALHNMFLRNFHNISRSFCNEFSQMYH